MPLWNVYCCQGTYPSEVKRSFAEAVTDVYAAGGMPRFYVNVIFTEVAKDSLLIGGVPREDFVRIVIEHARKWPAEHAESLLRAFNKAIHPYVRDRGLDWEFHIDEVPRELWTIQGMRPPDEGSAEEQRWFRDNRPSKPIDVVSS